MVDVPGSASTGAVLGVGSTVSDVLEVAGDHDWYRLTLTAGQEVRIDLSGAGTSAVADTLLRVIDAAGNVLAQNDDNRPNDLSSALLFRAPSSGTFFVDASAYSGTGGYQLSARTYTPPVSDVRGDSSTSAVLGIGQTLGGTLELAGDRDWYRVSLSAGQEVRVDLTGVGEARVEDTYLRVRDAGGNIVYQNDDAGSTLDSSLAFAARTTGTYFVEVGSFNDEYGGDYQVSVSPYQLPPEYSFDQIATQLISGYFNGNSHRFNVAPGGSLTANVTALTAEGQSLARLAMGEWSEIIGVSFVEVSSGGQLTFDDNEEGAFTESSYAGGIISTAHVNVSTEWLSDYGTGVNSYSFQTYLHEVGHALGLGHAGNYNEDASFPYDALFRNDSWAASVMSYFSQTDNSVISDRGFNFNLLTTPMIADILAMQRLYGLSTTTRTGNTVYGADWNASMGAQCLFDSGGIDTIDCSGLNGNHGINLNPGTYSNIPGEIGNVSIAFGTIIENARGGAGNDTLIGNDVANLLEGGGGGDILSGGAGNDVLSGGAGGDLFIGSVAELSGDRITDFQAGDRIVLNNAALTGFSFSLTGNTLMFTGGSLTLDSVPTRALVFHAAAEGGVQISVGETVRNDFNGDGRSDMLWRHAGGAMTDWLGQPGGALGDNYGNASSQVDVSWRVAGSGDFNGDGRADILWRHSSGTLTDWLGQDSGGFIANNGNALNQVSTSWQVAGTGDFNGDGRDDVLWRNSSGALTDWLGQATGGFVANNGDAFNQVDQSWRVVGTGDFNGDGRDDILWRHSSGALVDWLGQANGGFVGNNANASFQVGNNWRVVGTGDFDGNGRDDILWRNDAGTVAEWLGQANGGFAGNAAVANQVSASWHVAQIGDFNGDGRDDLAWRNDSGALAQWSSQLDGSFLGNAAGNYQVDASWQVQSPNILLI